MGKIHRIKKHFWKIVSQQPLPEGYHCLAHVTGYLQIGKRHDGSYYIFYSGHTYKGLLDQLIKEYKSGGSSSD